MAQVNVIIASTVKKKRQHNVTSNVSHHLVKNIILTYTNWLTDWLANTMSREPRDQFCSILQTTRFQNGNWIEHDENKDQKKMHKKICHWMWCASKYCFISCFVCNLKPSFSSFISCLSIWKLNDFGISYTKRLDWNERPRYEENI